MQATGRMRKNVAYFKVNYGIVAVSTTALVMFMNPWSLIVLAVLALLWGYAYVVRTTPLVINGRELRCGSCCRGQHVVLCCMHAVCMLMLSMLLQCLSSSCRQDCAPHVVWHPRKAHIVCWLLLLRRATHRTPGPTHPPLLCAATARSSWR